MLVASQRIRDSVADGRASFDRDAFRRDSIVLQIVVLGEAASRLPREFRDAHPEIPWADVAGMRHWLVHAYFQIDEDIVWKTAVDDVPKLIPLLQRILGELPM